MDKIFKKLDNIEQQITETNKEKNGEVKETLGSKTGFIIKQHNFILQQEN